EYVADGPPLGGRVTTPAYTFSWTVGSTSVGSHNISARATDSNGVAGTSQAVPVTVVSGNPTGFAVDQSVNVTGSGTVTTAPFTTAGSADTLVAFVSGDGAGSGGQTATVSGAGLAWSLVKLANNRPGDAAIWTATRTAQSAQARVTANDAQA